MTDDSERPPPAFYAARQRSAGRAWADWWVVLHLPYTLWHLSYVAIGAGIAPDFDGVRLVATLIAFLLAVGVGAHALDELHGRPLGTDIPGGVLVWAAGVSIAIAVVIGVVGITRVGAGLAVFIVVGVAVNVGYNLELFVGRLHNDVTFAAAWGGFPVLTGYYAQAETLDAEAVLAAASAYFLSSAQRRLSTEARSLRREVTAVAGTVRYEDGRAQPISRTALLVPLEAALKSMSLGVVTLAIALIVHRV